jgi:RimJ/RimL family protein N-acetyltransferase
VSGAPLIAMPDPPLRDGEVALRRWRSDDAEAIAAACQDPLIPRWTTVPSPYGIDDARGWLASHAELICAAELAPFAVTIADDPAPAGSVALQRFAWQHGRGEVGYWLAAPARGRGVMSRAVRLLAGWGFDTLGLRRIDLLTDVANEPSQRVAERAGFRREGVLRSYLVGAHGPFDAVMFARLRDDPA